MSEFSTHIVLDNGSDSIKAGFNGEDVPRCVIPSVIGKSKNDLINLSWNENKILFGNKALTNGTCLDLNYPILNGKIQDFDDLEKLWSYIFTNELKVKPESHNILISESLFSSNSDRDKIAQIMYEKFSVFHICIEPQPLLTFHYSNKNSGLIVESGETYTQVIPIFEKYIIPQGFKFNHVAGDYLTNLTKEIFDKRLSKYKINNKKLITKKIKEKFMKVNLTNEYINNIKDLNFPCDLNDINNYFSSKNKNFENEFILPDGNKIMIGNELEFISESLFNPQFFGLECDSIQKLIYDSISSIDVHLHKEIMNNVIIGGGTSMIKNFPERLKFECEKLLNKNIKDENYLNNIRLYSQPEREYSAWIGGSIYCSSGSGLSSNYVYPKMPNSSSIWITKSDYEDSGCRIFHRKNIL